MLRHSTWIVAALLFRHPARPHSLAPRQVRQPWVGKPLIFSQSIRFHNTTPDLAHLKRQKRKRAKASPLEEFFAKYSPNFKYDATKSPSLEFYRLCKNLRWSREDPKRQKAHQDFKDALVRQFNQLYGTDENNLANWQNLCYVVHIERIPNNLRGCPEAIRGTYVNLDDLVVANTTGKDVRVFDTERELSDYTQVTGKIFPKKHARAGGLLRYLLRHILNPRTEAPRRRKTNRRR